MQKKIYKESFRIKSLVLVIVFILFGLLSVGNSIKFISFVLALYFLIDLLIVGRIEVTGGYINYKRRFVSKQIVIQDITHLEFKDIPLTLSKEIHWGIFHLLIDRGVEVLKITTEKKEYHWGIKYYDESMKVDFMNLNLVENKIEKNSEDDS